MRLIAKRNPWLILAGIFLQLIWLGQARADGSILFLGDSLTAGFGVAPEESYPALIEQKVAASPWRHKVINAGISGDTTASGLRRVSWTLRGNVALFVLALGANDGLRGLSPDMTQRNLEAIIAAVRAKSPDAVIVLAGMLVPPNMGDAYAEKFKAIFPAVAQKTGAILIPFLLEGVAGEPRLNQVDGIHPTQEGHVIVAATVWNVIAPLLEKINTAKDSPLQPSSTPPVNVE